ncbi:HD-GYP domain-containing protein [bacterium]|nr:HD-GYP domain-containing protein [bacterium]
MEERLIEDFITYLTNATRNKVIYPSGHPIIMRSLMRTFEILETLMEEKEEINIAVVGDELIFEGMHLHEISTALYGFTRDLRQRGIEKITFLKGLKNEEFLGLIDVLTMAQEKLKNSGGPIKALASKGIKNITFGKIGALKETQPELGHGEEFKTKAKEFYKDAVDAIKRIVEDIGFKKRVNIEKARSAINSMVASIQRNRTPLVTLASLKAHDEYTFSHAVNVAVLTLVQGEALGLDRQTLNDLGIAGLLHDMGKLKVPEEILKKPGKLTSEEFELIKLHPADGAKILMNTPGISKLAYVVTFEHHIKYDLSGYPVVSREKGGLNLGSMLVRIADTYDAMRSNRYYAKEIPPEKTIKEMEESSGKEFEPVLLRRFIRLIGVYPPGTFVRLDTNEIGFVFQTNPSDPYRPRAKIVIDSNGSKIETPQEIDLEEKVPETGNFRRSIKESVDPEQFGLVPDEYM